MNTYPGFLCGILPISALSDLQQGVGHRLLGKEREPAGEAKEWCSEDQDHEQHELYVEVGVVAQLHSDVFEDVSDPVGVPVRAGAEDDQKHE